MPENYTTDCQKKGRLHDTTTHTTTMSAETEHLKDSSSDEILKIKGVHEQMSNQKHVAP
jgi:hypothetical protein